MHLTLRFIGDVHGDEEDLIVEQVASRSWKAPIIRFGNLHAFGGYKPTALFASVDANDELVRLQSGLERLLQQSGFEPDRRKFIPHVTLARLKGVRPAAVAHYLGQQGPSFVPEFYPKRMVLYSARQSRGGGPYVVEEVFALEN